MNTKKKEIIDSAKKTLHYNNLLIEQCENWLPAEEDNKTTGKKIFRKKRKNL